MSIKKTNTHNKVKKQIKVKDGFLKIFKAKMKNQEIKRYILLLELYKVKQFQHIRKKKSLRYRQKNEDQHSQNIKKRSLKTKDKRQKTNNRRQSLLTY
jgi:hypothetical protein